ncbi:MAG: class B sortase [Eggerthellaceae bacterium]|nr:class B sortase [Eggerthellaceae bacterium]
MNRNRHTYDSSPFDSPLHHPVRSVVRFFEKIVYGVVIVLSLLLALYAGYSVWYTYSLTHGSCLSDELAAYKPNGQDPTLTDLMALNDDVCAWITIDDTSIDYPIVQGEDDIEYLNKNVEGSFSLAGAIFLSNTNSRDFTDSYNIIYGHHVAGGAMFSDVLKFRDAEFFESHDEGILWLSDRAYRIDICASIDIDGMDKVIYQDPHEVLTDSLSGVLEYAYAHAVQKRSIDIEPHDRVIMLSTCEDATSFKRVVLMGKLEPMTYAEMQAAEHKNLDEQIDIHEHTTYFDRVKQLVQRHPVLVYGVAIFVAISTMFGLYRGIRRYKESRKTES